MAEALGHPRLGYYRRALPLGAAGDFTTAPEISQMFGELVGAWLAERWLAMGAPSPVALVELGPGRGTLMADALRATRGVPGFHARAPASSRRDQRARCAPSSTRALGAFAPAWHERFDEVPAGPAAARRQRILRRAAGAPVPEDRAGLARAHGRPGARRRDARLRAGAGRDAVRPLPARRARRAPRPRSAKPAAPSPRAIGARLMRDGGWALIVDYGYDSGAGASLQAVRGHRGAGILDRPGETDLSAHVDFAALAAAAQAPTFGPVAQGDFLRRLGILQRAESLKARAQRSATRGDRRGVGALDRSRPNGHLVPRPGRG